MLNIDESIAELKKYLKKLSFVIENNANFTLMTVKIVEKRRIDDLLCCIEANFPSEYKKYVSKDLQTMHRTYSGKSVSVYKLLKSNIQRRFPFSTDVYAVKYKTALDLIPQFAATLEKDIRQLYRDLN